MEIVSKVYNDWIRTNSGLCGFLCKVKGKGTKEELMEKVKEHVQKHELPIIVDDIPGLATTFKLVIIK